MTDIRDIQEFHWSTGRTARQLRRCIFSAVTGVPVVYVVARSVEIRYVRALCAHLRDPERSVSLRVCETSPLTLPYCKAFIRFAALTGDPHRYLGFQGRVEFDHAALRDIHEHRQMRWKACAWLEIADGCNVRHPDLLKQIDAVPRETWLSAFRTVGCEHTTSAHALAAHKKAVKTGSNQNEPQGDKLAGDS